LAVLLLILTLITALVSSRGITVLVTNLLIVCTLVLAMQVFVGNSGIISFGHVAFFGIGAYTTALLTIPTAIKVDALPTLPPSLQNLELGFVPAILTAGIAAGLFALITGLAFARMKETAMSMATLASLVMVHTVLLNWNDVTRGTFGIYGIPSNVTLFLALLCTLVILALVLLFKASPQGISLQATREDVLAAQSLGINVMRGRLIGWVLSAALMGAGGSLWAQNNLAFSPDQFFFTETFSLLSILIIGGAGSVTGAIAGATIVNLVGELLRPLENGLTIASLSLPKLPGVVQMVVAALIIIILILRPTGLLALKEIDLLEVFDKKVLKSH
jgi:branched-chain amino acid transport system permease protein